MTHEDKIFDLEERTQVFGTQVIRFCKNLERNEITRSLISQVIRSAISIGANYMEADGAESKKDFKHKIALCKKESKETKHWLKMIKEAVPSQVLECDKLWREAQELTLIFSKIFNSTMKSLKDK